MNNERVLISVGDVFGRLEVVKVDGIAIRCQCRCGTTKIVIKYHLTQTKNPTRSCGCLQRQRAAEAQRTHGMSRSRKTGKIAPEYLLWTGMINRCENPNEPAYPRYGGRGIKVHPEWRVSFEAFYRDMGPRPAPRATLDRIDNDGDYAPGNVRWATYQEQARNRRSTKWIEWEGQQIPLAELAEREGISYKKLWKRLSTGVPLDKALSKEDFRK